MHIAARAPAFVGRNEAQADDVFEHVRRGVDLDVKRTPERNARGGGLRTAHLSSSVEEHGTKSDMKRPPRAQPLIAVNYVE
jgi:hypothetical protein